jgi:Nucleoside phosphorylase
MKILLASATEAEAISPEMLGPLPGIQWDTCMHGVGLMMSTFHLTSCLNTTPLPDWVIQYGIAGAYCENLGIGEVVVVASEQLGDTGVEDQERFLDIFDMGFIDVDQPPFKNKKLHNPYPSMFPPHLKSVSSLTVNCATGADTTYCKRRSMNCDIESMEGAALHYVCLQKNIPFLQFRAISNYVGRRNKEAWDVPLALNNLHYELCQFIKRIAGL